MIRTIRFRFANESFAEDVPEDFLKDFVVDKEMGNEVFGHTGDLYGAVNRDDMEDFMKQKEMPKCNDTERLFASRILDLENAIQKGIDKLCEASNFEITYAEINSALLNILSKNNLYERQAHYYEEADNE